MFLHPERSRRVVRLAAPVVLAMLTQTAINLVDTIMVGRLPPDVSIAGQSAIGYSLMLIWAFGGFLSSIQVGTQAIVARRWGEERPLEAGRALSNSLVVAAVSGAIVSVLGFLYMPAIFPLFDRNPAVVRLGSDYARWRMLGVFSMTVTMSYKSFFDGIGRTYVHMVAAIAMNTANIVLNWLLIFGIGPFPALGVTGAGIASLLSTYIGLAIMVGWSAVPWVWREYKPYARGNLDGKLAWTIVRISTPSGLATVFVMVGLALFLKVIGELDASAAEATVSGLLGFDADTTRRLAQGATLPFGANATALLALHRPPLFTSASKIILDFMSLSFMGTVAVGTATATLVGGSLGRGKPQEAAAYGWESVKVAALALLPVVAVALLAPQWIFEVFNPSPEVAEAGRHALRLMALGTPFVAVGLVLAYALFGAGETHFVMWAELLLHAVCLVPLAWFLAIVLQGGVEGAWAAGFVYLVLLAAAMAWRFHGGKWKERVV